MEDFDLPLIFFSLYALFNFFSLISLFNSSFWLLLFEIVGDHDNDIDIISRILHLECKIKLSQ
jgi:hypothetical protein